MPLRRPPIRYAIYTRQSVAKLEELSSCEAQFMTCRRYVETSGEPGLCWCEQRFDDLGHSGADLDRPGMQKLRKVIALGGLERVYAVALDRVSRRMRDAVTTLDEFERAGVELHFVHQPDLTSGPQNRFLKHVLAAFAEFERDMITTRITETRAYLRRQGRRLAGPAPFGYDADPATRQLVPNSAEARRARALFKRAANGQTPAEIAKRINHLGWRTKQWTAKRSGEIRGGGKWSPRQVAALLRNPVYVGRFADGEATRPGCHSPIVDEAVFHSVQDQLSARRTTSASRVRNRQGFVLRGKVICPNCHRPLCTYVDTAGKSSATRVYDYYRCRSTAGGRPPCKRTSYFAWDLEKQVLELLDDESTWSEMLACVGSLATSAVLIAIWRSLDVVQQRHLLPQIVDRVEPHRTKPELRITFDPRIVDVVTTQKTASEASFC